jgi:hypothetical protein
MVLMRVYGSIQQINSDINQGIECFLHSRKFPCVPFQVTLALAPPQATKDFYYYRLISVASRILHMQNYLIYESCVYHGNLFAQ